MSLFFSLFVFSFLPNIFFFFFSTADGGSKQVISILKCLKRLKGFTNFETEKILKLTTPLLRGKFDLKPEEPLV